MLDTLEWLALEVKYLDRAREFYIERLGLPVERETDREVVFDAGGTGLVVRRPDRVPRGGLHTHYAFSIPAEEYDDWWERLSGRFDLALEEHRFGSSRSLYFDDPDGHCVEIGQSGDQGNGITGVFEVVLEVADLDRAESFYTRLGFGPVDRGEKRRRIRLSGPMDLELWEPQLGLADARGGVHVDLGFGVEEPREVADRIEDSACSVDSIGNGVRAKDPDGHYLTFH